jgi:hypothetical protein
MNKKDGNFLNARFNDDTYYRLSDGYVETNTSEENIKNLEERFKKTLPRKSTRMPPPWKEKDDCKCFLSVDLKTVPNGNKVGDIGTMVVEKVNRHVNRMCPIHRGTVLEGQ